MQGYEWIAVLAIGIFCGKQTSLAQRGQGCTVSGVRKASRCSAESAGAPVKRSIKLAGKFVVCTAGMNRAQLACHKVVAGKTSSHQWRQRAMVRSGTPSVCIVCRADALSVVTSRIETGSEFHPIRG